MSNGELTVKKSSMWIYFQLEDKIPISESRAMCAQTLYGKNPDGYDFIGFKCFYDGESKTYTAQWQCSSTCD